MAFEMLIIAAIGPNAPEMPLRMSGRVVQKEKHHPSLLDEHVRQITACIARMVRVEFQRCSGFAMSMARIF